MKNGTPLIFDIKRHALEDGPGIRTTVFFKGCPLRCRWCHNPESMDPGIEIGFYPSDCTRCGDCVPVCPTGAIRLERTHLIDRTKCNRCGACAAVCPGRGLRQIGRRYEIEELVDILLRDRAYYQASGGGVTLSGGEPTLDIGYASRLLRELKSRGIHTAIETCGFFDWAEFKERLLDYTDLILFDVKLADPGLHREYTGQSNELILNNLAALTEHRPGSVIARLPLIPGVTTCPGNVQSISDMLREIGIKRCWLLPYNPLGFSKRKTIGKPMVDMPASIQSNREITGLRASFAWAELVEN